MSSFTAQSVSIQICVDSTIRRGNEGCALANVGLDAGRIFTSRIADSH
jgi:hypothetical protein